MFANPTVTSGLAYLILLVLVGCGPSKPKDYSHYNLYRSKLPASILVLPPTNQSVEVNAPYSYLSTITEPIAEAGYYVFPVAVVDAYMKENGLPTPADMHAVPLDKLAEVFDADAVLYIDIQAYGQEYKIVSSGAVARAEAELIDLDSGQTLWSGGIDAVEEASSGSSDNILGALIGAAVAQAVGSSFDASHGVAQQANRRMVFDRDRGFLLGPYHPGADQDVRGRPEPIQPAEQATLPQ